MLGRLRGPAVVGRWGQHRASPSGRTCGARSHRPRPRPTSRHSGRSAWSAAITRRPPSTTCGCGSADRPATSCSSTPGPRPARSKRSRSVATDRPAFVHRDSRDLTGFIDGTANPTTLEAPAAALVPDDGPGAAGSHVLVMRWVHDLRAFDAQPIADQERVFGRTKWDSVEMEPDAKPATAHIARVEIEDAAGDELPIYRRSVPYGTVEEAGLYFVAFSADRARLDRMLGRMFGLERRRAARPPARLLAAGDRGDLLRAGTPPARRGRGPDRRPAPGVIESAAVVGRHAAPARGVHDRPERRQPGRRLDRREPAAAGRDAADRGRGRLLRDGLPRARRVRLARVASGSATSARSRRCRSAGTPRSRAGWRSAERGLAAAPVRPAVRAGSCSRRTAGRSRSPRRPSRRPRPGDPDVGGHLGPRAGARPPGRRARGCWAGGPTSWTRAPARARVRRSDALILAAPGDGPARAPRLSVRRAQGADARRTT